MKELNATSSCEESWIVYGLVCHLLKDDLLFDCRIHLDSNKEAEVVTWWVGHSRGSLKVC